MAISTDPSGSAETSRNEAGHAPARPDRTASRGGPSEWLWPYRVLGYVIFLSAWQFASGRLIEAFKLPSPTSILAAMAEIARDGELWFHASATLQRVAIALTLVFLIGGLVGLLMGTSRWWEDALRDIVNLLISLPGLVFVLIFLIIFGLSPVGPIVAIVVTNFAFVTIQVWEGIRAIPDDLLAMSKSFGVAKRRVIREVVIPALAPFLFTALTYTFALTWKLTMLTELFGSSRGVGFKMRVAFARFDITDMLAWALAFYIFAIFLERVVFQRMSTRFFRWRESS